MKNEEPPGFFALFFLSLIFLLLKSCQSFRVVYSSPRKLVGEHHASFGSQVRRIESQAQQFLIGFAPIFVC